MGVSNREKFLTQFNKTLQAHKLSQQKIRPQDKGSSTLLSNGVKYVINRPIETIFVITSLYLFITMGFLTIIFASPVDIGNLARDDIGKYVVVSGELRNVHKGDGLFSKDTLWIKEGNSIILAEYYPFRANNIYLEGLFSGKPITVSGRLESDEVNNLIINAHFLNKQLNIPFLFSAMILATFLLSRISVVVTKWER